jgi:hypothetical protein
MAAVGSLELIGDLVDPGLRAVVVLARRSGYADRAHDVVADLDRKPAAKREDARVFLEPADAGSPSMRLTKSADGWRNVRAV